MQPTNNGKPWNVQSQELEYERAPRPETIRKNSVAAAVRGPSLRAYPLPSKRRASELPLDTAWMQEARREADGVNRIVGYALLAVTFVIFAVLLWPWLAA